MERLKQKDAQEYELQIKELELKKEQMEEAKRQFEEEMKLKREQLEGSSSGGGGGGSSSGGSGTVNGNSSSRSSSNSASVNKQSGDLPRATAQSILDLGHGPVSASNLADMVSSGKVVETTDKYGNTVFKNSNTTSFGVPKAGTAITTNPSKKKEEKKEKTWWEKVKDIFT